MTDVHDVNDLYGLPLDRFVAERTALAKALRAGGDRDKAASVAKRRKPSVAAWAVNQLVRTQAAAISALFETGDALQRTQADLLAGRGGDARALREAAEGERAVVDELAEVSRGLLSSEGYELTQATLDRVSATLHAAALDEGARDQVRDGCLERELRRVGFGTDGSVTASADSGGSGARVSPESARRAASRPSADSKAAAKHEAEARARAEHADRKRAEREQTEKLKAARKAEAQARRIAERSERELQAVQERRDGAVTALRAAEEALELAQRAAAPQRR